MTRTYTGPTITRKRYRSQQYKHKALLDPKRAIRLHLTNREDNGISAWREMRYAFDATLDEWAVKSGISKGMQSVWEHKDQSSHPRMDTLVNIATMLDMELIVEFRPRNVLAPFGDER